MTIGPARNYNVIRTGAGGVSLDCQEPVQDRMTSRKSSKLTAGSPVRVKPGVTMPEFQDVDISGWTGVISDSQGRGADVKYFVEWDGPTLARMPETYRAHCEAQGLYHGMACLRGSDVEAAGEAA